MDDDDSLERERKLEGNFSVFWDAYIQSMNPSDMKSICHIQRGKRRQGEHSLTQSHGARNCRCAVYSGHYSCNDIQLMRWRRVLQYYSTIVL